MKEIETWDKKVTIRRAVKSDAEALIEYCNIIGGETGFLTFERGKFGKSIEEEEAFIESISKRENALFIIAEADGKVVGNLNYSGGLRERTAHTGEFGVSVLKEYWGHGIGEDLIKFLIEWSKTSGIVRKINLRVRSDNFRGIQLYKRLGFVEEGISKRDFLIDGAFYDSLLMGLLID